MHKSNKQRWTRDSWSDKTWKTGYSKFLQIRNPVFVIRQRLSFPYVQYYSIESKIKICLSQPAVSYVSISSQEAREPRELKKKRKIDWFLTKGLALQPRSTEFE